MGDIDPISSAWRETASSGDGLPDDRLAAVSVEEVQARRVRNKVDPSAGLDRDTRIQPSPAPRASAAAQQFGTPMVITKRGMIGWVRKTQGA